MLRNYLKQIIRNLGRNRVYSILNIGGLAAGLACFAFIALWVKDELSYDKFHGNANRIVRVIGIEKRPTGNLESAVSSAPMAAALKSDYAEVEDAVRMDMHEEIIDHKGQKTLQSGILVTDPSFFKVFNFALTRGNETTALADPFSVILTESVAKKYFGNEDPIGKALNIYLYDSTGQGALYKVTGVMPDAPANSHFNFTMLASFKTAELINPAILTADGWGDASYYTYLLLKKGVDYKTLSFKISQFYKKYIGEMYNSWKDTYFYGLQPLTDIHLRSHLQYEIAANGNINNVYIFFSIGIFILLLAAINYMNLATARSVTRAKEAGIRKVVGAGKGKLVTQFLLEAVVTSVASLFVGLILCLLLQPYFFDLTEKNLSPFSSPALLIFLVGITILVGLISGIYPAFVISGFKPIKVLKGSFKTGTSGVLLRKSLVMLQFMITIALIIGVIIVNFQMRFVQQKDLGYNKNGLVFLRVHGNSDVVAGYTSFKNEMLGNPRIVSMATSNALPAGGLGSGGSETVDVDGNALQVNTARLRVDNDYLKVYGIELVAGRDFGNSLPTDSIRKIILNETAVRKFGWKDVNAAIGKPFKMGSQQGVVTGVVKDFHFTSLHETIGPLAIYLNQVRFSRISMKTDLANPAQTIAFIEKTWKKHFPTALFDYSFFDRQIGEQYEADDRFQKIFLYFSILSLLIGCLGLYGLIAYAASQRTKEIGIRKVLGARVSGIAMMLSKDFLKLVVLAFIITVPFAWYAMNNWLQDFAYRINITWWMFAMAGAAVVVIALITVSFQAIKAAIANPVKSLRTE